MRSSRLGLCLVLGLTLLSLVLPAHADDFAYYAVGSFQFDSMTISGNAGGICSGQCLP